MRTHVRDWHPHLSFLSESDVVVVVVEMISFIKKVTNRRTWISTMTQENWSVTQLNTLLISRQNIEHRLLKNIQCRMNNFSSFQRSLQSLTFTYFLIHYRLTRCPLLLFYRRNTRICEKVAYYGCFRFNGTVCIGMKRSLSTTMSFFSFSPLTLLLTSSGVVDGEHMQVAIDSFCSRREEE